MIKKLKSLFLFRGDDYKKRVQEINSLESEIKALSDEELKKESQKLREHAKAGEDLNGLLPRAFALVREAARRTLEQRHFDVQLVGGIVLHKGAVAEMLTGEGKTLTATLPVYLNALDGKGAHVITVNDYLTKRDVVWMGQIYHFLGLKVACIAHESSFIYDPEHTGEKLQTEDKERDALGSFKVVEEFLRPVNRKEAYEADIIYGTNHEFGFDYLRDNLTPSLAARVQREHNFAVIDEVDSILIDEARTPLIISAPDRASSDHYKVFARAVRNLNTEEDYTVDEKLKSVAITESGINKIERMLGVKDLYALENLRLVHYLEASLKAKALFERDKDYVVRNGEVIIVDQFTGRLMLGRRYSSGLHQAIEAKEGVYVKEESKTYAQITIQNYFRLYKKISGMTGTAQTSAEEFHKVYNLEVESIPPNKPMVRDDRPDRIFRTTEAKYSAIVREVKERHENGQPVLVGTVSIEKNEFLGQLLRKEGLPAEILNAKNHEREGAIIAQAGKPGVITIATNMAGRGVDIVLGGNPGTPEEAEKVRKAGGLHVIGTERHEARRIDNQLRGRAGRQGDPGSSQFFVSTEDDLMRIFGGERIKGIMDRFKLEDELPPNKFIGGALEQAQSKIEGFHFDARKHLLEYDDILNKQRTNFYGKRLKVLQALDSGNPKQVFKELLESYIGRLRETNIDIEELIKLFTESYVLSKEEAEKIKENDEVFNLGLSNIDKKLGGLENSKAIGTRFLGVMDFLWMNHLEDVEALTESVRIRAYGQKDPLVEYRKEGYQLFQMLQANIEAWLFNNIFKFKDLPKDGETQQIKVALKDTKSSGKIGRNDPCPCGSGKKYKKCHGA
ncbi:MAG: preprotein translocase subunit SecA [Candidatus Colwellbacteria bacterium]|nr:preprotein translocase subunit SecA [Candidatus Colwellbacteria bacterium]